MEGSDTFVTIFTSLIAVFLLLGGFYLVARKMGGKTYGNRQSKYLKIIDRLPVSRDKSIEIIEVGDKAMIVGVTATGLYHLYTLELDQLKELEEVKKDDMFRSMFNKLIGKDDGGNTL